MKLVLTTPLAVIVEADDVRAVRAEDETGAFGISPRHADLLTVLAVSVLTWQDREGHEHHVAVRGGVLSVREGRLVEVATPEAVVVEGGADLAALERAVLARFRARSETEESAHGSVERLRVAALRRLYEYLQGGREILPGVPVHGSGGGEGGPAR
ncbi:MAG TPA: F0F1 ATP synthase subunit epsilon [Polyangia bacterium]|nr:F0F1 ATP synthase subunit epsilon [Polyangia bacterium]